MRNSFRNLTLCAFSARLYSARTTRSDLVASNGADYMEELTIFEIQEQMAAGQLTARELTAAYLARIAAVDQAGPQINSVIEVNPDAPAIAEALDAERAARGPRGPLHGVPILIKDNIDTHDRMQTTAGSLALVGSIAPRDADVVARLRAAGAVILGKTNLSEWANFRSTHSTSGWSSRGGQTKNPYALDRNPCGSSSGSAVAVAANLCTAAVGTETDGSITCPANVNGIVGIKPTLGLVSQAGIIPIAHSQDTAGPMARTVADAALLLAAMADPQRAPWPLESLIPAGTENLSGVRLGVARNYFGFNPAVDAIIEECIGVLRDLGAVIVDKTDITTEQALEEPEFEVLLYEFKADLNAYLAGLGPAAPVHSLAEVIAFNERHREQVMPYFGQEIMLMAQEKGPLTDPPYLEALAACRRLARTEGLDKVLDEHRLDAIIAPTGSPAWLTDYVCRTRSHTSSTAAAVAGYPHITVPAGYIWGLPVGLSFIGRAWSEPALIRFAYAFEQATRVRRPPQFLPTINLPRA
ncbi:MAG: amidase [Anaerolineae bacterium]